ncbi:DUF3307 domain-containing protein [Psychroflexus tropicus]|uniref:DUF3307 domain-containing protein n=1 Tax=Psychroflexus tropicus TaxID=197345 RepID=UPI000381DFED|nr:DUF3307 domain-containing protein [Psychroflexus tropicus]
MMLIILQLLLAHLIGDFVLQPQSWVESKEKKGLKSKHFWLHIGVHLILLLVITKFKLEVLPYVIALTISHLIIDILKIKLKPICSSIVLFFGDQFLHLVCILVAAAVYVRLDLGSLINFPDKGFVVLLALVCTTYVSGVIMKVVLSRWDLSDLEGEALHKAGWYIGILERLFILGFVCLNYWAGIGFLIAAKSIFRFSDLSRSKDRKLTEYVLIGTLLSYGLALVTAAASLQLWDLLS